MRSFVDLFALAGVAILQPYLDVTAKNAQILVTEGTTRWQATALALFIALLPPAIGLLLEWSVGLIRPSVRPILHAALCGCLVLVLVIEVVKPRSSFGPTLLVSIGIVVAVAVGILVARVSLARTFLRFLAIGCVAFIPLFLFASPATKALDAAKAPPAPLPWWCHNHKCPASVRTAKSTGERELGAKTPHRVVLVILDELPTMSLLDGKGHIDGDLFPNFAKLEAGSTWYRNNTTVAGYTQFAVPAILTGRYPHGDAYTLPTSDEYPRNIFTLFGAREALNVHEVVTRLCTSDLCGRSPASFASLLSKTSDLYRRFASPNRAVVQTVSSSGVRTSVKNDLDLVSEDARGGVKTSIEFLKSLRGGTGLHLDMVHMVLPHFPWERLPNGQRYDVPLNPPNEPYNLNLDEVDSATARMRHLIQLQASDRLVGRIVHRLQQLGAYDDSLVVVTADHGVSFTPGTHRRDPSANPKAPNLHEIMYPPLFVKYPGEHTGVIDERRAESIDILPTIADVEGARLPWPVDGHSLRAAPVARPTRRFYPEIQHFATGFAPKVAGGQKHYIEVAGIAEYPRVLAAAASRAGGDPALRPYRIGPYGGLIGRRTGELPSVAGPAQQVSLLAPERFLDPSTDPLRWVWNYATMPPGWAGRWIAVANRGRIVALGELAPGIDGLRGFSFLLPPPLVHPPVQLQYFGISGDAAHPVLARIASPSG